MLKNKKFGVISLGCDKNRVDTEKLLGLIKEKGYSLTDDINEAQILIINTCAFLQSAREEAIETIIEFDNAIKVAYEFYKKHPDETLIVVTSDHETGGISLGCGRATIDWKTLENQWIECGKQIVTSLEENAELNKKCSIGWATVKHTGCDVPVYAIGVGAEAFCGKMDNTEFKSKILRK